ncbi:MAG: hypothetical protein J7601_11155, partial [Chloroflexi bacterium]|nr:hypothetical protein [Chloroflexota bacterium]
LARMIGAQRGATYFDLEGPVDMRQLSTPLTILEALSGLVIIDEIQRRRDHLRRDLAPINSGE